MTMKRRTLLQGSAALAAGMALTGPFAGRARAQAAAGAAAFTPEEGASLPLLR